MLPSSFFFLLMKSMSLRCLVWFSVSALVTFFAFLLFVYSSSLLYVFSMPLKTRVDCFVSEMPDLIRRLSLDLFPILFFFRFKAYS